MKIKTAKCIVLKLLIINSLSVITLNFYAQNSDTYKDNFKLTSKNINEKIILQTNRNIYAVNDIIRFNLFYLTNYSGKSNWSSVVYIELLRQDGSAVIQKKFKFTGSGTSGYLEVPSNLLNGVYYLKAYTKWMRNLPSDNLGIKPVKIINLEENQLEGTGFKDDGENVLEVVKPEEYKNLEINIDKLTYGKREQAGIELVLSESHPDDFDYSISVVRQNTSLDEFYSVKDDAPLTENPGFLPEIKGIVISGNLIDKSSKQPVNDAYVCTSLLDVRRPYISTFKTKEDGKFYLSYPEYTGIEDFFIAASKDNSDLEINIDNDFCNVQKLPEVAFKLNAEERELAKEIYVNAQLNSKFRTEISAQKLGSDDTIQFYGKPNKVYYTKDYIDLPELREFIFEIVNEIVVYEHKGEPYIHSKNWNAFPNEPFLMMVDNIPIIDIKAFLKIKISTIERVELVDESYVIGDKAYAGVINVISHKGDIAGIKLTKNSLFFKYQMLSDSPAYTCSQAHSQIIGNSRIPYREYTLLWGTKPEFNRDGIAKVDFYTSDISGKYKVKVSAINKRTGEIFQSTKTFHVD